MSSVATTKRNERSEPRPFDFRHPSTLSRDDARALQSLQETFAHGVATMLAAAVRASIDVKIGDIEQLPHAEFVRRMPNPSLLSTVRLESLTPLALLQIDPDVTYSIVELLLGGPGTSSALERAHTEVEESLLAGLLDRLCPTIDEAFAPITTVQTTFTGQESNPTFVQIASATDMVVSIGLDIGVDAVRGMLRLALPVHALRPHLDALATESVDAQRGPEDLRITRDQVCSQLERVDVVAKVRFDTMMASSDQLVNLRVGDVMALNHGLETPLLLEIDGVALHDVSLGRVKRSLAVEVVGPAPNHVRRPSRLSDVMTSSP